ncbi:MAG: hypothetical protein JST26_05780 [Bacteroidetes bacterium]|nr:hypothetical protein [Bacteroidota bacterium]
MKQEVANNKKSEVSIKRIVSEQFLNSVTQAIETGLVKNEREFALLIEKDQAEFSRMKNTERGRYVDIEMIYKAVNLLGFDANHIFLEGGGKKENLLREGVHINGGNVSGNNNVVLTGQAVSNHGDVYLNVQKLVQSLPAKDKNAILKKISDLESKSTGLNTQIEDLKKTIDRYEREMEKDKKIIETQEKLIKMMEGGKGAKK